MLSSMRLNRAQLDKFGIATRQTFFDLTSYPTILELINDRYINHTSL